MIGLQWLRRLRQPGLAFDVSLLVFGAVFITMAGSTFVLLSRERRQAARDLETRATAMAQLIAANSEFAIYTGNTDAIRPLVKTLDEMDDVAYLQVVRTSAEVVFDWRLDSAFIKITLPTLAGLSTGTVPRTTALEIGQHQVLRIVIPVLPVDGETLGSEPPGASSPAQGVPLGFVQLGVTLRPTQLRQRDQLAHVALATLLLLTIGIPLTHALTRRVTAPLRALVDAAEAIGDGRFEPIEGVHRPDEIGTLARAFGLMARKLGTSRNELEEHQRTLEATVTSRTAAFEEARKAAEAHAARAEEATRAKSQFLANMSHEIRTPMNGVMGMLELLRGTDLVPRQRRFAETAFVSAEALLELINDVLDFSKIEAGHLKLHVADFDLHKALEDVCDMLALRAHEKGVDLSLRVASDVHGRVHGDSMRIRQVLVNLLGNAIKFTARGQVQVLVTVERRTEQQQVVRIAVQDSGIGMSQDVAEQIFDPFTQADSSTTRLFGGTGLGLAIAKQLVDMMGGVIELTTELGIGSTFSFTVPLEVRALQTSAAVDAKFTRPVRQWEIAERLTSLIDGAAGRPTPAEASERLQPRGTGHPAPRPFTGARVLLAEDNLVNQKVAAAILERLGCVVVVASTGIAAVREATTATFDIILMDCMMPQMDGYDATRAIREAQRDSQNQPRIVALTGSALDGERERCLAAGMDDYLAKPYRMADMEEILRRWTPAHRESTSKREPEGQVKPATPRPASALDMSAIASLLGFPGGARILSESVAVYRRSAPQQLSSLRVAISSGDRDDVRRVAHTLKSSSATLGLAQLAHLLRQIEVQSAELATETLEQLCTDAESIFDAGEKELALHVAS